VNGRYLHLPAASSPDGVDECLRVYGDMDSLIADLELGDDPAPACSCGGDPDTCEANQTVKAQIAAEEAGS
jgi:hypothetical protein